MLNGLRNPGRRNFIKGDVYSNSVEKRVLPYLCISRDTTNYAIKEKCRGADAGVELFNERIVPTTTCATGEWDWQLW